MREIKFRVWFVPTHEYKCYFADRYGRELEDIYCNIYTQEDLLDDTWIDTSDFEKIIFEQYTGLKDKNGDEIYEGDILQEELDFGDKMVDGLFVYLVKWDESCLCYKLDPDNASIHDELWMVNGSAKIIGNIHENPELLKGGKDERA